MKEHEFLRVIEEICLVLKLRMPTTAQVIEFYKKFIGSDTHSYRQEIVIGACIYLATKMNEEMRKIRDIINVIFLVTALYKLANTFDKERREAEREEREEEGMPVVDNEGVNEDDDPVKYLPLDFLKSEADEFLKNYIPNFSLEKYTTLRDMISEAEQHLLRILNYDLDNTEEKNYRLLLYMIERLEFPESMKKLAFSIYNDSFFLINDNKVQKKNMVPGAIYLATKITGELDSFMKSQFNEIVSKDYVERNFECTIEELEEFGVLMMDHYQENF